MSQDWKIVINGNVENVYVNVTFNNTTIYNKSGGGVIGSSKVKAQSLQDRVENVVGAPPPKSPTLQEIANQMGKELKSGVNGNMTKEEFEADGNTLDQAFKDVVVPVTPLATNPETIAEWFNTLPDKGKGIGRFIKYLRDDCGIDGVSSTDLVDDNVKAQLDDFLSL